MAELYITEATMNKTEITAKDKIRVAAYCRVSTDFDEQVKSFDTQVSYYKKKIKENKEWEFVDIFTDKAISGTRAEKRPGFLAMIEACNKGLVDMIITKSISRFARNTIDTLKYVRKLKELNVAIFFENENINTLSMKGEFLLTVLSSIAQQESINTSEHEKKGFKMAILQGNYRLYSKCLGYDHDKEHNQLIINEDEAEVVKYIYKCCIEGMNLRQISKSLQSKGIRNSRGSLKWYDSTVYKILTNEKYIGDLRFQKMVTLDPISKKRIMNNGIADSYYIKDHHEPIISKEDFELVAATLKSRRNLKLEAARNSKKITGQIL